MYEYERYVCNKETLKATIDMYGVAIIPAVLDEAECEQMVSKIWDYLEHITQSWETPLNREDKQSWREFYRLYPSHSMLLQHWSVGQSDAAWYVRQNIKCVEIFAHFWNCDVTDLLVSFDGLSFNLPPEITKRGWNMNKTWFHTDQSYTKPDFACIQSYISGLDVEEGDATLSVMEGSNKYHREFAETFNITNKSDWYKLNKEDESKFYAERGCEVKHIKCPKGSIVLWDSRTIHCGIQASKHRLQPNIRAAIYLCYMPRAICSDKNLAKKQKAFEDMRTSSHYPCHIKLFGKQPRTYGGVVPEITHIAAPVLNELGRRLAGF